MNDLDLDVEPEVQSSQPSAPVPESSPAKKVGRDSTVLSGPESHDVDEPNNGVDGDEANDDDDVDEKQPSGEGIPARKKKRKKDSQPHKQGHAKHRHQQGPTSHESQQAGAEPPPASASNFAPTDSSTLSPARSEGDMSVREAALRAALQQVEDESEGERKKCRPVAGRPFAGQALPAQVVSTSSSRPPLAQPSSVPTESSSAQITALASEAGRALPAPRVTAASETPASIPQRQKVHRSAGLARSPATRHVTQSKAAQLQERAKAITTPDDWLELRAQDFRLRRTLDVIYNEILLYNQSAPVHRVIRVPPNFIDPIAKTLIADPVRYIDGTTMDRRSIAALQFRLMSQLAWTERRTEEAGKLSWFQRGSTRSFFRHFVQASVTPDRLLRVEIQEWIERILGVFSDVRESVDKKLDIMLPTLGTAGFTQLLPLELLALETIRGALWEPATVAGADALDEPIIEIYSAEDAAEASVFLDLWEFTLNFAEQTSRVVFAQGSRHHTVRVSRQSVDHDEADDGDSQVFLGGRRGDRKIHTAPSSDFWNTVVKNEHEARKRLVAAHQAAVAVLRSQLETALMRVLASASRRKSSLFNRSIGGAASGRSETPQLNRSEHMWDGFLPSAIQLEPSPSSCAPSIILAVYHEDISDAHHPGVSPHPGVVTLTVPQPEMHSVAQPSVVTFASIASEEETSPAADSGSLTRSRSKSYVPTRALFTELDELRLSDVIAMTATNLSSNIIQRRFVESVIDLWLDEEFDVKLRLYRNPGNRRASRLAKLWLLNNTNDAEALLEVESQFLKTSMGGGTPGHEADGSSRSLDLPRCEAMPSSPVTPSSSSSTPRPISLRHNKPKPALTHWSPSPSRPQPAESPKRIPAPSTNRSSSLHEPTAAWLHKSSPKPPAEPRVRPEVNSSSLQWRAKIPGEPMVAGNCEAPRPPEKKWFTDAVKELFSTVNSDYLRVGEWSSSSDDDSSGDDGCEDDDYDGLNTLLNFLKVTNTLPKGKRREEDEQRLQDERIETIKDLITSGVRKFASQKKAHSTQSGASSSGVLYANLDADDAGLLAMQQRESPRFPVELVRGVSATPTVAMESAIIDCEFPTSFLIRELNHRYEEYDARAAADRKLWLQKNGFTADFRPYEHPDERARRLAMRDAQVLAEVSMSSLPRLKLLWEGFGTGFQSSRSMIHTRAQTVGPTPPPVPRPPAQPVAVTSVKSRGFGLKMKNSAARRQATIASILPPRRALLDDIDSRTRLVPRKHAQ
jgi:hypothetical protein